VWDGKEVGREAWSANGGTYSYKRHVDHTNDRVSDFQSKWTFAGLPPKQLTPDQRLTFTAAGAAAANQGFVVSLPLFITGQDAPGAPQAVAKASGDVFGLAGEARGVRESLADQQPVLAPSMDHLKGAASWQVPVAKPGICLISCQVTAPYYGAKEQSAPVVVAGAGGAAAAAGGQVTDAGGGRATAAGETGQPTTPAGEAGNVPGGKPAVADQVPVSSIGVPLGVAAGKVMILAVQLDGWADQAGLIAGSQLTSVNDKPVQGMTLAQVKQLLSPQGEAPVLVLALTLPDGFRTPAAVLARQK